MLTPKNVEFTLYQRSTLDKTFDVIDSRTNSQFDFTGWSARMHIREKHTSPLAILELITETGGIVLISSTGISRIRLMAHPAKTAFLPSGKFVYDIELIDPAGNAGRVQEGIVKISPQVTQSVITPVALDIPTKRTELDITQTIGAGTEFSVVASGTGYTKSGHDGDLGVSEAFFEASLVISLYIDGVEIDKSDEVGWVSSQVFTLTFPVDAGDKLIILS